LNRVATIRVPSPPSHAFKISLRNSAEYIGHLLAVT
jgi:hypothetical protein